MLAFHAGDGEDGVRRAFVHGHVVHRHGLVIVQRLGGVHHGCAVGVHAQNRVNGRCSRVVGCRRKDHAGAVVLDRAHACIGHARAVGRGQGEGFAHFQRRVLRDGHAHQQGRRFTRRCIGIGRNGDEAARGVGHPSRAVEVFQRGACVHPNGGGAVIELELNLLAFHAGDGEDGVRRAFVHRHVVDGDRLVVVQRGRGADHRRAVCGHTKHRVHPRGGRVVGRGGEDHAGAVVLDGAGARIGQARGRGGRQCEGLAHFQRHVLCDGHTHQQRCALASCRVTIGRNCDEAARGVSHPGGAVEVFQCRAGVGANRGGAADQGQLYLLAFCASDGEDRIRRAFVHGHVIDRHRRVVVQRREHVQHRGAVGVDAQDRIGCWCGRVVGRCRKDHAGAVVFDGADANVGGACRVGGGQGEGFAHFQRGVLCDPHAHQQRCRFARGRIAVRRNRDEAASGVRHPGRAVEVFDRRAGVGADRGSAAGQGQLHFLAFHTRDREDGVGRAFVHGHVVDGDRAVVVQRGGGAHHGGAVGVNAKHGIGSGCCRVVWCRCKNGPCAVVLDGARAHVGRACNIGGRQGEGFAHFQRGVCREGHAHQQGRRLTGRGIAIACNGDVAARGVDHPGRAVEVFERRAGVRAHGGGAAGQGQLNLLAFYPRDREDGVRRAFVHGHVVHSDRAVVVQRCGGAHHRCAVGVDAQHGVIAGCGRVVGGGRKDHAGAVVHDGGDAGVGRAAGVGGREGHGFGHFVNRVLHHGQAHQQWRGFTEGGVAIRGNSHIAARGVSHPGGAVEIFQRAARVGAHQTCAIVNCQLRQLAFYAGHGEHHIG